MRVLVAYASRHGATRGIAERIGTTLTELGHPAEVSRVEDASELDGYDAYLVGAATYATHWMKEAVDFVHEHRAALVGKPVWLFASGPLGQEHVDAAGHDLRELCDPKECADLSDLVQARGHKVFFGALDPEKLSLTGRALRKLPAAHEKLPAGDFRDWDDVDAWTREVAEELSHAGADESRPTI